MRKTTLLLGFASCLFLASACGPQIRYSGTQASPVPMRPRAPEQVELYRELPPERPHAEVGFFSARDEEDDKPLIAAFRKRAAKMGCDAIVIGGSADMDDDEFEGMGAKKKKKKKGAPMLRAACVVWTPEEPVAQVKPPEPPEAAEPKAAEPVAVEPVATEKPDGAGGFLFGQSIEEAQTGCKDLRRRWKQIKGGRYTCSLITRTAEPPTLLRLGFCGGRLCEIIVESERDPALAWEDSFKQAREPLVQKYGEPKKTEGELPDGCGGNGLPDCIADGRAKLANHWWWASGERLVQKLVPSESGKGVVQQLVHSKWPLDPPAQPAPDPDAD
jgi:hypothetical protein